MSQIKNKFLEDGAVNNAKIATGVDAAKIADGSVSNTEFQYLNGVTSGIQTQLDAKVDETVAINTAANSGLAGGGDLSTSRSLSVDPNNAASVTAAAGDFVLIADVSDSNNVKKVTVQSIADLASGSINEKATFVLAAGDITNQYVDLSHVAKTNSINLIVKNAGAMLEGASYDYSVSYTGGAGGNTRINFLNDLATGGASALVATDVIQVQYER